jgi:hypothetical protein
MDTLETPRRLASPATLLADVVLELAVPTLAALLTVGFFLLAVR